MNNTSRFAIVWSAAGAVLLTGVAATQADFFGQTVTAQWRYPTFPDVLETHDVVVGDDIELPAEKIRSDSSFDIDIDGDTILFTFHNSGYWTVRDFNGWWFHDTDGTIPEITGYTIDEVSGGIDGLSNDDLSFDEDSVWGNFAGVTHDGGSKDFIRLKVSFVASCAPCDANCDGSVDLTDVEPFILLLLGGDPCAECTGDTNNDGSVDLLDVEGFIGCLLG